MNRGAGLGLGRRGTGWLVIALLVSLVVGLGVGTVLAGGSIHLPRLFRGGSGSSGVEVATSDSVRSVGSCGYAVGEPLVGGPSVELVELGREGPVWVEGAVYPRPDYEGDPWTQWGQGLALPDGRFLSAIGDHRGPDGNSFIYEYDPDSGTLATLGDVLSYLEHEPGAWGYGKVHGHIVAGPCGEVYLSTYWGTNRDLRFSDTYRGDVLLRLDPDRRTIAALGVPVQRHGVPSLTGWPEGGLLYGEAIDPLLEADDIDQGPFFAYDVVREELVFEGPHHPHEGFRNVMVDARGRAYYSIGGGELAVYDPQDNQLRTHPHRMPGAWLRASTSPLPDGRVVGVTRDPDTFFVLYPSGEIEALGSPPAYTTSVALHPGGDRFFYVPEAHGDTWQLGGPLTSVDIDTGEQSVIVELNPLVEAGLGLRLGGTYNIVTAPSGDALYIGMNAGPLGSDDGFGEVVLLVVHLP